MRGRARGLALIPARAGSKGVPHKNIMRVRGRPLIAYSIQPALRLKRARLIDDVVVTTDSERIRRVSVRLGADAPFVRPKRLSSDRAKSLDVVLHALDYLGAAGRDYDFVVLLQPTSPLREYRDIRDAIALFRSRKNDSLISAYRDDGVNETKLYYRRKGCGVPLLSGHNAGKRRQDLEDLFIRNGAIFITSTRYLRTRRAIVSETPLILEMPKRRSLEIDTPADVAELRRLLGRSR
jgi:CMP-N,N'-diacetyllegionaminic acid synthase